MNQTEVNKGAGPRKYRKRVGRGPGSGHGKTAGRGMRGYRCRSGSSVPLTYEGGQMPFFRRIPKRGFSNKRFAVHIQIVNLGELDRFDEGAKVGPEELAKAGLIDDAKKLVKILGDGSLKKKIAVSAHKFSKNASEAIAAAGGDVEVIATPAKGRRE